MIDLSLKHKTYPELKDFYRICADADEPDVDIRNTIPLFTILKRSLSINPRLIGHYITRSSAISSFGWSIIDKANPKQKHDDVLNRVSGAVQTIIDNQIKTVFFGALLIHLKTTNTVDGNCLAVDRIYESTEFDYDESNVYLLRNPDDYADVQRYTQSFPIAGTVDYLFDSIQNYPFRGGLLRSIMPAELLRYSILLENANYLRKLKGILQIINNGGTAEDQKAAEDAARTAVRNNYVVTDDTIGFQLNAITSSAGGSFKDFNEVINRDIAIAILGQANTTELPQNGGSRAALQIQRMISADIFYSDMCRTENLVNKLLLIDYRLNQNPNAQQSDLPYKFAVNLSEEQDLEKNANVLSIISGFMPVLKSEAYGFLGFTAPNDGDEIFQGLTGTPQSQAGL